ncbi:MAG: NAD(P)-binding domain-containing protein, partial [Chloroflexi bacterium]|nr:NAD(P)-binding domain-containing protein [Chloroflexota bacterium]
RAGKWTVFDQVPYLGTDVYGKTLGIIGLGRIGEAVARRAAGFAMKVLYHSRTRREDVEKRLNLQWTRTLPELLRESDYVSVHVPLVPETRHLIGAEELALMKPSAFLINTSRGGTVDPKALYDALASKRIAGAALDVTEPEPVPLDDPLLTLPNVVFTPHIASASAATLRRMGLMAAENIIAALTGEPMPSCVNPEAQNARRSE